MRTIRVFAASLSLLVLAHSAAAQLTEKQAVAQVKAATKAQLKSFKSAGSGAQKTLSADLGEFEDLLTDSLTPEDAIGHVNMHVLPFVLAVETARSDALAAVDAAAADALQSLGATGGAYPKDLYYGTGGVLDDFRVALDKAVAKARDAALKRLAKTESLAEKLSNLALEVELRLPSFEAAETVDSNEVHPLGEPARVDLVISVSSLGASNDGWIEIAGSTAHIADKVDIGYFNKVGIASTALFPPDGDGRFESTLFNVPEGGLVAFAEQLGGICSTVAIGMR